MATLPSLLYVGDYLDLADGGSLELAVLAGRDLKLNSLALVESLEAIHLNLAVVNEQVVAALTGDEAVALVRIEPLNSTLSHVVPFFLAPQGKHCAEARYTVAVSATGDILPYLASHGTNNPPAASVDWCLTSRP